VEATTGRGEVTGGCGLQVAPAEYVALDDEDVGDPTSRWRLLDNLVADEAPITRRLADDRDDRDDR